MAPAAPARGETTAPVAVPAGDKSTAATSGKTSGKPEVESSGKSDLPLLVLDLPLTPEDDLDVLLEENIDEAAAGWRLERNSNGYYRWRWQLKDTAGEPVTYVNKSGKAGYRRGSKYVPIDEAKSRL